MDFLCGQVSLHAKKDNKKLVFLYSFPCLDLCFICLYDLVHVGVLSFGYARLVFWSFVTFFWRKKNLLFHGILGFYVVWSTGFGRSPDSGVIWSWYALEAILLTCYDAICIRSGLCVVMICLNYLLRVCVVIKHFCVTVDAVCWEIHATTKDWPLLREREMLITCVAFCLQLSSIKNFRLLTVTFDYLFNIRTKLGLKFLSVLVLLYN